MKNMQLYLVCLFLLSSCSSQIIKSGIYSNSYGKLKLNTDNTFDYYYHVGFKEAFSKGIFSVKSNKLILKTDSSNLPKITNLEGYSNSTLGKYEMEFRLEDEYLQEKDTSISSAERYFLIINDSLTTEFSVKGYLKAIIKGRIVDIRLRVFYDDSNFYLIALNKSITTQKYIPKHNSDNSFKITLNIHPRMFNVRYFNDRFAVKHDSIIIGDRNVLHYCPNCKWENDKMNSPVRGW